MLDLSRQAIAANTLEAKTMWADYEMTAKFRGQEYGCQYAEAFVRISTLGTPYTPKNPVPGLWYGGMHLAHDE